MNVGSFTVLSLFDGLSGAYIALESLGYDFTYYASEIDSYCLTISNKNYPNIIQLGDVKQWKNWNLPKIDLLIGGSPCQGFSSAGNHLGFKDVRSKLLITFLKIKTAIQPTNYVLENVIMKQSNADLISKYLHKQPILINSSLVSAQSRKRNYWTNLKVAQPIDKNILLKTIIESGTVDRDKARTIDANYYKGGSLEGLLYNKWADRPIRQSEKRLQVKEDTDVYRKFTPLECERLQTIPEGYTEGVPNKQRYKMIGNSFTVEVIKHILKEIYNE